MKLTFLILVSSLSFTLNMYLPLAKWQNEFDFQSWYYVHFRTNTLGKCMNHLTPTTAVA